MWWGNDYNFVRTAAVVMRMLMLQATKIHASYDSRWRNNLVSENSIACQYNKDSIPTDGVGDMPCPANGLDEAGHIAACYDAQFNARKMMLQIGGIMPGNTGWFTETMAVVKKGESDIKFWFIITTWQIRKTPHKFEGRLDGFLYETVPIVAVHYLQGNRHVRDNWRREQHPDFLQLEQLMGSLRIVEKFRQAILDNRPKAV
jgi:hypothetical protein